ncbi:hypothetical protein ASG74_14405 [Knoellia sp. Soil729]|nr:hypothetical protein ASG74_14405 [Knoellia sp. Soil729]
MLIKESLYTFEAFACPALGSHRPRLHSVHGTARLEDLIDPLAGHSVALCQVSAWDALLV